MRAVAAVASVPGLDALKFVRSKDRFERTTMLAIADAHSKLEADRFRERAKLVAYEIVSALGQAMKKR